ncbi:MAG: retropepsin-like domain-containing protein [Armatimonadetes bacterium]|nr:retropepsin-like domain-containing protein [Armatimonadota bacterium]
MLALDLVHPEHTERRLTVNGYVDTGCSRSLFDGRLALALGLDPSRGDRIPFVGATGVSVIGLLMPVRLAHPALGDFNLTIAFAQVHLSRNLLGRDFLDHVQLGVREHRQEFYLSPER